MKRTFVRHHTRRTRHGRANVTEHTRSRTANQKQTPKQKPVEKIRRQSRTVYDITFSEIGGCAGFRGHTEYNVGIGRIAEALHCIVGSTMKSIDWDSPSVAHIEEEISIIEKDTIEYDKSITAYDVNNTPDTITNAQRVQVLCQTLHIKLQEMKPRNEADRMNIEIASLAVHILDKMCHNIQTYPSEKPFQSVREKATMLRFMFDRYYIPQFSREGGGR